MAEANISVNKASQLLHALLVELTVLPERVHLVVNLLSVECCQLLPQFFKSRGGLDMGNHIKHLYLCWSRPYELFRFM